MPFSAFVLHTKKQKQKKASALTCQEREGVGGGEGGAKGETPNTRNSC